MNTGLLILSPALLLAACAAESQETASPIAIADADGVESMLYPANIPASECSLAEIEGQPTVGFD